MIHGFCLLAQENPTKNPVLGLGVWGTIFIVSFERRVARKLRNIILLHFGLVTFRFHFWKFRKVMSCIVFEFLEVSMPPATNYFYLWRDQMTPNSSRKNNKSLLCFESQKVVNRTFWKVWKRQGPGSPEDPSNVLLKVLKYLQESVNWTSWIWDQYLQEKMKWEIGNFNWRSWNSFVFMSN